MLSGHNPLLCLLSVRFGFRLLFRFTDEVLPCCATTTVDTVEILKNAAMSTQTLPLTERQRLHTWILNF